MKKRERAAAEAILTIIGEDLPRVARLTREVRRVMKAVVTEAERDAVNSFVLRHDTAHDPCICTGIHQQAEELRKRRKKERR